MMMMMMMMMMMSLMYDFINKRIYTLLFMIYE